MLATLAHGARVAEWSSASGFTSFDSSVLSRNLTRNVRGKVDFGSAASGLQARRPALRDPLADPYTATVFAHDSPVLAGARQRAAHPVAGAPQLDLDVATTLGHFTSVAYCTNASDIQAWNCTRCGRAPQFQPLLTHFDPVWDLLAYLGYSPTLNANVIAFRGTDSSSWSNWVENMRYWRTDRLYPVPNAPSAKIHSGFFMLWNSSSLGSTVTDAFQRLSAAHPDVPLYVVGHSMGGALAQLCALDVKFMYDVPDVRVYTFGAPRIGDAVFQEFFNDYMNESWRFTHNRDMVPSVPLQLMGFHHVAQEVWLVDEEADANGSGNVATHVYVCDGTGEDASCHNSVCHMGLCLSLADHLVYLGLPMFHNDSQC